MDLPVAPLPDFRLARAVAASAAFPIGLKPMTLRRVGSFPKIGARAELAQLDALELTDGGVLENLGAESLPEAGALSELGFGDERRGREPGPLAAQPEGPGRAPSWVWRPRRS